MGPTVLLFTHDPALVRTRTVALETSGYAVTAAIAMEEFLDHYFAGNFDLILLCNTLRTDQRNRAISIVRHYGRPKPLLAISSTPTEQISGADMTVPGDAESVLSAIREALCPAPVRSSKPKPLARGGGRAAQAAHRS